MQRWLLVFAIGCGSPHATPAPVPTAPPPAQPEANDPPEPVAPAMECDVTARPVFCRGGFPVRDAYQPSPFATCPRELPGEKALLGTTGKRFSAVETRKARAAGRDVCCYLEWTWSACD